MNIRTATMADLEAISSVEVECFPMSEAATKEEFIERIRHYGNHFWLMFDDDKLIAFVDGFVTDEFDLTDEIIKELEIKSSEEVLVLSIITLGKDLKSSTMNLQAPLIINVKNNLAKQFIMQNSEYKTKHPLIRRD